MPTRKAQPLTAPGRASVPARSAGVLLHITCLPGPYGIGDLGPTAHAWVNTLARARQSWWQLLPLGPPGEGDSPYQCYSAFAGNPNLISPDGLRQEGLLRRADLEPQRFPTDRVDYARVNPFKARLLSGAWERFQAGSARQLKSPFQEYCLEQSPWLDDYALFMAIKEVHPDLPWNNWPRELVLRKPAALRQARRDLQDTIGRHQFGQFLFHRQLEALRQHAQARGIRLIGDLPMFVSGDSVEVWAHPELFLLDRNRRPTAVAGVPPDYFSKTGQRWGNPLYNWPAMRRNGYAWWVARIRAALTQVDLLRIDHFRGFEAYWRIPAHHPTAQRGQWIKAPGDDLFKTLRAKLGHLPFIAEDLGMITREVEALRDAFDLPGMRVLQFAFGKSGDPRFLPHNYPRNTVVYTGTHDNDTTLAWYRSLTGRQAAEVRRYAPDADADAVWGMIRLAWSSVADRAIVPLQDILALGSEARMNTPGTSTGNWQWRFTRDLLTDERLGRLEELTEIYGRSPDARSQ